MTGDRAVDPHLEIAVEDERDGGRFVRLAEEEVARRELTHARTVARLHDQLGQRALEVGPTGGHHRHVVLAAPGCVRAEDRAEPRLRPRERRLLDELAGVVVEPVARKRTRSHEPLHGASVRPDPQFHRGPDREGASDRNGQRRVGRTNENPGRFPAVCTKMASPFVTTGSCRISGFLLVGNLTRGGPTVTGVRPTTRPPECAEAVTAQLVERPSNQRPTRRALPIDRAGRPSHSPVTAKTTRLMTISPAPMSPSHATAGLGPVKASVPGADAGEEGGAAAGLTGAAAVGALDPEAGADAGAGAVATAVGAEPGELGGGDGAAAEEGGGGDGAGGTLVGTGGGVVVGAGGGGADATCTTEKPPTPLPLTCPGVVSLTNVYSGEPL